MCGARQTMNVYALWIIIKCDLIQFEYFSLSPDDRRLVRKWRQQKSILVNNSVCQSSTTWKNQLSVNLWYHRVTRLFLLVMLANCFTKRARRTFSARRIMTSGRDLKRSHRYIKCRLAFECPLLNNSRTKRNEKKTASKCEWQLKDKGGARENECSMMMLWRL